MNDTKKTQKKSRDPRNGLRTSATLATALAIVGHAYLGFEQAYVDVVYALLAGYISALVFEWIDAKANSRPVAFQGGGIEKFLDFLLAPHMTAITTSFIVYAQDHHWAISFAVVTAIASKYVFRVKIDGRYRHFFNPSNFGIALVLTILPWCTSLPWMYMDNVHGVLKYIIPLTTLTLGLRLNWLYTKRLPTIAAFLVGFVIQAVTRALIHGTGVATELVPLTGYVMVLFVLFMITDPMTSPSRPRNQVIFGGSMALVYGVLMMFQTVYVLFYAVSLVAAARGVVLYVASLRTEREAVAPKSVEMPITASA